MRFTRPAIVLKQPWLVFITVAFTVGVVLAAFWPGEEVVEPEPLGWGAWLFWLLVLALLALGVWMLCHAEDIVIDAAQQRVTQIHRFLHREVKVNHWRFADFTAVAVTLKIDKEEQGSSMPTGGATLTTARTVYTRRYELGLRRPDQVLKTADRTLTAPRPALNIPLPADGDAMAVEAAARTLAALGGWPALRQHYTLQPLPGAEPPYTVKVVAGAEEPLA
jgi:hypothetical protein